jgi:hypothetical protein
MIQMTPDEEDDLHTEIAAQLYSSMERITKVAELCAIIDNEVCPRLDNDIKDREALIILDAVVEEFEELVKEDSAINEMLLPLLDLQNYLHSLQESETDDNSSDK